MVLSDTGGFMFNQFFYEIHFILRISPNFVCRMNLKSLTVLMTYTLLVVGIFP